MTDDRWQLGAVPFRFQFGDIIVGRMAVPLLRRSASPDEPPLDFGAVPAPPPACGDAEGYVVWSQPIVRRFPTLVRDGDRLVYAPRQYRRFSIDLTGDFDRYLAKFSGKTRSSLRRKMRKFTEVSGGSIDWREYRTTIQLDVFFPLARKISAKSYQERLLDIGLPSHQKFVDKARQYSATDNLRAYLLFLDGEPVSYLYCPIEEDIVKYDHLGYDPAYAALSPGTVLQMLALEALFAEGRFRSFDFTEGEGQHKELFSTNSSLCADFYVVDRRVRPAAAILLHYTAAKISAGVGRTLDRLKLKTRLRRLIRGT